MKIILELLRTSKLTNMEFGQLIRRHLSDLSTINPNLLTDAPYNSYVLKLTGQANVYEKALAQIQKNEETDKIVQADRERDKALIAFGTSLKLYSMSDIPEEAEASHSLGILLANFKNLANLGYEAETLGIDKLISELNSPLYINKVNQLLLGRYVARMTSTNNAFKTLFGERMVTMANTESYDMKNIRTELMDSYNDFSNYVLSMAKISDNTLFALALNLLNTARKYYADQLARHAPTKVGPEKPAAS